MLTPFSPHIRATSRASFTIAPFHLAHVSLTANHVRSSRILSPPLFSQRLANGSISVWGKVGECTPPYLVMPLTVEPTKPRLCHDERFLNLWVKDSPFTLDYISNLPRYVGKDSFQTTIDDKSRYDHVRLVENSRNSLASNGRECIMYTTPYHSGGKPARTFTTLLVWGPLVTSDLWACHVVNISTTDMLDN